MFNLTVEDISAHATELNFLGIRSKEKSDCMNRFVRTFAANKKEREYWLNPKGGDK